MSILACDVYMLYRMPEGVGEYDGAYRRETIEIDSKKIEDFVDIPIGIDQDDIDAQGWVNLEVYLHEADLTEATWIVLRGFHWIECGEELNDKESE